MNRNFVVFMLITTSEDLDNNFFKQNFIEDVYGITGEYDLLLKMKFSGVEEFNKNIIELRKNKKKKKLLQ
jgi:DNA-binding Lrp family transcriptional regulator